MHADAAAAAVEVVRAFGRDQTLRARGDRPAAATALDRNLEIDALELAVVAGTTAVGGDPPEELLTYARDLAADYDGEFPPPGRAPPDDRRPDRRHLRSRRECDRSVRSPDGSGVVCVSVSGRPRIETHKVESGQRLIAVGR